MTVAVLNGRALVEDFYFLVHDLNTSALKEEMLNEIKVRIKRLQHEIKEYLEKKQIKTDDQLALRDKLTELSKLLEERKQTAAESFISLKASWGEFRTKALPLYDRIYHQLEELKIEVPKKRHSNYLRNLFHVGNAIMIIGLIQYILPVYSLVWVAFGFAAFAWTMEVLRRRSPAINKVCMKALGKVAHPHETHHVNSSTWFVTALLVLALIADPMTICIAVATLGFADPMAAIVGRRWGRIRLYNNRTLVGSFAFLATAFCTSFGVIGYFYPTVETDMAIKLALSAGLIGTPTEAFSGPIDDNFSIPVMVTLGVLAAMAL